jgi:hypothetical protein
MARRTADEEPGTRDAGVDPKIRRELLGHTTDAMTDH